jgi:hypothetical protein
MRLEFAGPVWYWRGPAPFHFVSVPPELVDELRAAAEVVSYGWGMVPVTVALGRAVFATSLWPKDGGYIVPLKAAVRHDEGIRVDDVVTVAIEVAV